MNKDVIYIDVEDDITIVVGKIKSSTNKIVALVPPNRTGVLQSAVNMRLIARTAEQAGKRVVLISHNSALASLAAAAKIPVARTLQSKPELAKPPVLKMDGDDIIEGEMLPVGELDEANRKQDDKAIEAAIASNDREGQRGATPKKKTKVPNFSTFRKRLLLIGGGVALLVVFLVWAIWLAPRATIFISAKSNPVTVDRNVRLTLDGESSVSDGVIRAVRQEQKQDISVEFTASGTKRVGDKATGTMRLTRTSVSSLPLSVPSGTMFSAGDYRFTSTEAATLSGSGIGADGVIQDAVTVKVQAVEVGEEFNLSSRQYSSNVGGFTAMGSAMSGGTSRQVTVVSDEDIAKATEKLSEQKADGLKKKLISSFDSTSVAIEESFRQQQASPVPSVAVDAEASSPVTLKSTVTASMLAVSRNNLSNFLNESIKKEISGRTAQKIYDDGMKDVRFAQFTESDSGAMVRITANGSVGPQIDESSVKEQARGKRYGDVQTRLEEIDGVEDVDVKFWPFWVRVVPGDTGRITVEFKLKNVD